MKTSVLLITCSLVLYMILIGPFVGHMRARPFPEKLGYVPSVKVLKIASADQKELTAALLVMKVLMYFGGLIEQSTNEVPIPPDYPTMSRLVHNAVQLDPYNMDAYYFAQAFLVWDVGAYKIANDLLEYGMKYRSWDWYLPFFAGFNAAYFLKDYDSAARFYRLAADLQSRALPQLGRGLAIRSKRSSRSVGNEIPISLFVSRNISAYELELQKIAGEDPKNPKSPSFPLCQKGDEGGFHRCRGAAPSGNIHGVI